MKKIFAVAAMFVASQVAHADYINDYVHAEVGVGVTNYQTADGRWYQQGMPGANNDVTRTTPEFSLGLTGGVITRGKWGVDWHADYVNLGRAAASCECTPMDENYSAKTHTYTPKYNVPPAYFTGSGRSQGVVLSLEPYYWWQGLRWSVEAGAYVHRDSWDEHVYNWQVVGSGAPQNLHVGDAYWGVAPVAGVGIGNGRFTLAYRHYFMRWNSQSRINTAGGYPPLWNDADVLELKIKF